MDKLRLVVVVVCYSCHNTEPRLTINSESETIRCIIFTPITPRSTYTEHLAVAVDIVKLKLPRSTSGYHGSSTGVDYHANREEGVFVMIPVGSRQSLVRLDNLVGAADNLDSWRGVRVSIQCTISFTFINQ